MMTSNHIRGKAWISLRRRIAHAGLARPHDERDYSFVDATGFALVRSKKIREARDFDGDFGAAGSIELRPDW